MPTRRSDSFSDASTNSLASLSSWLSSEIYITYNKQHMLTNSPTLWQIVRLCPWHWPSLLRIHRHASCWHFVRHISGWTSRSSYHDSTWSDVLSMLQPPSFYYTAVSNQQFRDHLFMSAYISFLKRYVEGCTDFKLWTNIRLSREVPEPTVCEYHKPLENETSPTFTI